MSPAKRTTTRKRSSKSSKDATEREETASATSAPADEMMYDRIRQRAYEIYQARNGAAGDEVDDWLVAEREVRLGYAPSDGDASMLPESVSQEESRDAT